MTPQTPFPSLLSRAARTLVPLACWLAAGCGGPAPTEAGDTSGGTVRLVAISAGDDHTCGLSPEGRVLCWGGNEVGQIGLGSNSTDVRVPSPVAGDQIYAMVTAGAFHTCALNRQGIAYCWGFNVTGQIGIGSIGKFRNVPSRVLGNTTYHAVAAGGGHTCGWTDAGEGFCWGARSDGSSTVDSTTLSGYPVHVLGAHQFVQIATGGNHRCGLSVTGEAYCWGTGGQGRLGTGSDEGTATPRAVVGGLTFAALDAGDGHACGIVAGGGTVQCWGLNADGQLGTGGLVNSNQPVAVAGGVDFTFLTLGGDHSCGLTADGTAYCWGDNRYGQLGNGTRTDHPTPTPVSGGLHFATLSAGRLHTCGLTPHGQAYCWGFNQRSQLGEGTTTERLIPTSVASGATFTP